MRTKSVLSITVHSHLDPACFFWPLNGAPRVPSWVRRLFGWNCEACRSCEGHVHSQFSRCVNGLSTYDYLRRASLLRYPISRDS